MTGRPPLYESNDDGVVKMQALINNYFSKCDARTVEELSKEGVVLTISKPEPYTVAGLAVHLDMCRDTLCEYEKNPLFSDIIKKAKAKIEAQHVRRSMETPYHTGCLFALKTSFGYVEAKDKTPETHVHMEYEKLTDRQKKALVPDILKELRDEF